MSVGIATEELPDSTALSTTGSLIVAQIATLLQVFWTSSAFPHSSQNAHQKWIGIHCAESETRDEEELSERRETPK